jgi:sterol-4alpha-carboxylate 3-dehydrogenase (decarboxylating)
MPPAAHSLLSVLITGGAGSSGRALLKGLQTRYRGDLSVSVLDLKPVYFERSAIHPSCDFEFYQCDISRPAEVSKVVQRVQPEVVIHCARIGLLSGSTAAISASTLLQINFEGTRNVLEAAKGGGVKGFVYLSTADVVVGDSWAEYQNVDEGCPFPKYFENPYNESIALAENLVRSALSSAFRTTVIRPATVIDSSHSGIVARVHRKRTHPFMRWIPVNNEGHSMDFTSVDNVALALVLAAESLVRSAAEANGRVFFVSDLNPTPNRDVELAILGKIGYSVDHSITVLANIVYPFLWISWRIGLLMGGPVRHLGILGVGTFNCNLIKQNLGYKPVVSLQDGITRACEVNLGFLDSCSKC